MCMIMYTDVYRLDSSQRRVVMDRLKDSPLQLIREKEHYSKQVGENEKSHFVSVFPKSKCAARKKGAAA